MSSTFYCQNIGHEDEFEIGSQNDKKIISVDKFQSNLLTFICE